MVSVKDTWLYFDKEVFKKEKRKNLTLIKVILVMEGYT